MKRNTGKLPRPFVDATLQCIDTLCPQKEECTKVIDWSLEFSFFFFFSPMMGIWDLRCLKERFNITEGRNNMGKLELNGRREKA